MKAFLMHRSRDFDLNQPLPENEADLCQDLELDTLFGTMAQGDKFLGGVAKVAVLCGLNMEVDEIIFRQDVLKDCLSNSDVIKNIYSVAVKAVELEKGIYLSIFSRYPVTIMHRSLTLLGMQTEMLRKLRDIADEYAGKFSSDGFSLFFDVIKDEISDEYFKEMGAYLAELELPKGFLVSAQLGAGNRGISYTLRKPTKSKDPWIKRIFQKAPISYTLHIGDRDENGAKALSELKDRGANLVANSLAQAADHVTSFFEMLRIELAFYMGCLNLYEQLMQKSRPICFPVPTAPDQRKHRFAGLYDVCLTLISRSPVTGNDGVADGKDLVVITGANQGGKSTFLRSVGVCQLMMQSGMFVPAESYCANICDALFTHYKREEDSTMTSGKLDEELSRFSHQADLITSHSMLLFNESFAATNEREGSEIARQITRALIEKHVKTFFVTHLYDFAESIYAQRLKNAMFLRAERCDDGRRTFKLIEAAPQPTAYGTDLYNEIFLIP
ncbi:MutS-related protein [Pseudomonas gingeri]|uniref:DNA mismatch repair protein MutS n=1 Tax=Pseudomonas gingeri TaxID=117681 RepID=A0A7Y7WI22_9PSED|nr:DNA mismatch repair protein MutS [Pseudomonas gingeri]NWB49840.1 DNA mismatch repair protein MutS [Pseudomonas gingeri]